MIHLSLIDPATQVQDPGLEAGEIAMGPRCAVRQRLEPGQHGGKLAPTCHLVRVGTNQADDGGDVLRRHRMLNRFRGEAMRLIPGAGLTMQHCLLGLLHLRAEEIGE